jgi:hypothetical protein
MEGPGALVQVVWRDAHAATDGWTLPEEIDQDPCMVTSVGYLLAGCKPGHLVLAQSVIADQGAVDHVLAIPVAMVAKIKVLAAASLAAGDTPI